jgi:bla regulator protein blaR1
MTAALINHLWQSTLFVVAAGVLAAALRANGAHVRHRIWLAASLKFVVPFSLLLSLGGALPWLMPAAPAPATSAAPALSVTVDRIAQPFPSDGFLTGAPIVGAPAGASWLLFVLAGVWAGGFLVVVWLRLREWRRVRAAVQGSVPSAIEAPLPVRSSSGLLEPGVVGLWRPVLLVPAGIENRLTPSQLTAVLAHEVCHVARHDNLTSAIHMVVEAVFWFHPLVWWVGARLVEERERACDEHVLRVCGEPTAYAESILTVCKLYVESPLACVSGVTGSGLKKRIAAIMGNHIGRQLSPTRKMTLAMAAVLAFSLPLAAGMLTAPLRALAGSPVAKAIQKFDVVSVKPCEPNAPAGGGRSGSPGNQASPGYLNLSCMTLRQLVSRAYIYNQQDHLRNREWGEKFVPGFAPFIRGGPAWADSDRFTIEARADGVTDKDTLTGPMLRALLEDRFRLKTHRATEERSMWALTVATTGPRIEPTAPDSCYEFDPNNPTAPRGQGGEPCGEMTGDAWGSYHLVGVMLGNGPARDGSRFVDFLWDLLLQPVIDRTGLHGRYSFAFDFTPDESTPGVHGHCGGDPGCVAALAARGVSDARPTSFKSRDTIFKALETLGLKLEKTRAPAEYLVIDRAERPTPDAPLPAPPARAAGAGPR